MAPKLTVHNAEIKTASVEIKTLTISGKQVTLAVFRQLPQEPLINEDGTMNGVPWGTVNYHPDAKACPGQPHWHTVWQDGSELRRSVDPKTPTLGTYWSAEGDQFLTSAVLDYLTTGTGYFENGANLPVLAKPGATSKIEGTVRVGGLRAGIEAPSAACSAYDQVKLAKKYSSPYHDQQAEKAVERLRAEVTQFGAGTDELLTRFVEVCEKEAARRDAIRSAHQQLADLPQLFIAV